MFYVSTGGLLAVTYTDIVQMALLLLGIVVLAVPLVGAQLHKMGANLVTDLPASFFDLGAWGWPTIGTFFWKKSCSAGAFASMLSATVIAVVWFIGGKVSTLPLFSIDALWPSFGVSASLYVVICLTHHQTPAEQKKAEKFYAAK